MKSALFYTIKVCLVTLVASVPVTMAIGWAYIGLIMLMKPVNYAFSYNLPFAHMYVFVSIMAIVIMLCRYFIVRVGYRRFVNDRPIAYSIVIFLFYLVLVGIASYMGFVNLLFSYGPMFLIAYICGRIFSTHKAKAAIVP